MITATLKIKTEKHCPRCKKDLPVGEFGKDRSTKDGMTCYCRKCKTLYVKAWQSSNHGQEVTQAYLARSEEPIVEPRKSCRLQQNKRKVELDRRNHWLKRKYGITLKQQTRMYIHQDGRCLDCGEPVPYVNIFVSYNYHTEKVRGLIGRRCYFVENAKRTQRHPVLAYEELYLLQNKSCAICGQSDYLSNMEIDVAKGLICLQCAGILSRCNRNPIRLIAAVNYLSGVL